MGKQENVIMQQRAEEERQRRMNIKIQIENDHSAKLQREKGEMMEQRRLFGLQIAADKHEIMQDIELMKLGKVEPKTIAEKYGMDVKPQEEMTKEARRASNRNTIMSHHGKRPSNANNTTQKKKNSS